MAATLTDRFPIPESSASDSAFAPGIRRRIPRQAARAIRLLGHAAEYLANEFLHDTVPPSVNNPRLQAVELLMALNRDVYSECPKAQPSLVERWRPLFGFSSR
jgi:hypothetical protein